MRRNQDLKAPSLELQRIGVSQKPLQFSGREIFLFVQFVKNRRFECTAVKLLTLEVIAFDDSEQDHELPRRHLRG